VLFRSPQNPKTPDTMINNHLNEGQISRYESLSALAKDLGA